MNATRAESLCAPTCNAEGAMVHHTAGGGRCEGGSSAVAGNTACRAMPCRAGWYTVQKRRRSLALLHPLSGKHRRSGE